MTAVDVAIRSWGASTAYGVGAARSALCLRAGLNRFLESPFMDRRGAPITLSWLTTLSSNVYGVERLFQLAVPALQEALRRQDGVPARLGLVLALPERLAEEDREAGLSQEGHDLVIRLIEEVERIVPVAQWAATPRGHAGGALALARARQWIAEGLDAVLVGGVDTHYDWAALEPLEQQDRLLTADNLDGRIPGEASAFLYVTRAGAGSSDAEIRVMGLGMADEPHPMGSEEVSLARGFTEVLRDALRPLRAAGRRCGYWWTDLTHETYRTREFQILVARFGDVIATETELRTPARELGDVGGATLPLFVALAAETLHSAYAPDSVAVCLAASDRGARGAVALEVTS